MILCEDPEIARASFPRSPRAPGGPLMHVIAAKAVALGEALRPEFATYAAPSVANAQTLGRRLTEAGSRSSRAAPTPILSPRRPAAACR